MRMLGQGLVGVLALVAASACSEPLEVQWKVDLGGASVSNPLVTSDYVAVGSEVGVVIVEHDGRVRCRFEEGGEVISAPQTDGERIYFGSTNYLFFAITPQCEEVWKFAANDRIKSDPLVADGTVYLSSYDGHVYALNAADKSRKWVFPAPDAAADTPTAQNDAAAASAGASRGAKLSGSRSSGALAQAAAKPAPRASPPVPTDIGDFSYSSPLLHHGALYLGNLDGRLYALNASTGELLWYHTTDGPITSSPRAHNDMLFFGSNDGNIYALRLSTRKVAWKYPTRDWVNSSPLIADGVLYIGSNDRTVLALDTQTGRKKWSFATEGPAISIPALYQNLVFAAGGSGDGTLYALQRSDGSLFWRFPTGGKIQSDPVVVGDKLYLSSTDHMLYVFQINKTQRE